MFGDCHVHMVLDGVYYRDAIGAHRGHVRDDLIRSCLAAYADAGVRFLRDGGDAFGVCERAKALAGEYGIEYRMPAYPICLKGRYGEFIGRPFETMAEYRSMVADVKARGGDFIKIMVSGIMDFNQYGVVTSAPLTKTMMAEMIAIAHGEGFSVMAHANGSETIIGALEAGVDSIEHGAYMSAEAVRAMAEADAAWVPTLSTLGDLIGDGRYPDEVVGRILEGQLENVALCAGLGGTIALGSDAGAYRVTHPRGAADEYVLIRRAVGAKADDLLLRGEAFIRRRFRRQ